MSLTVLPALVLPLPSALSPLCAYVFITGRRQTELDAAVKAIGKNITGVQSDASNLADLSRLFATETLYITGGLR